MYSWSQINYFWQWKYFSFNNLQLWSSFWRWCKERGR